MTVVHFYYADPESKATMEMDFFEAISRRNDDAAVLWDRDMSDKVIDVLYVNVFAFETEEQIQVRAKDGAYYYFFSSQGWKKWFTQDERALMQAARFLGRNILSFAETLLSPSE